MAKQIKIKEIAQMAGVSAGTVDRILHNRGNVSESSRAAVEKVLKEVNYKYNIHTSAVSFRKEYNIVISMPTPSPGEYWGSIQEGIEHALAEYSDISLNCRYAFYNQFDIYSCRAAFDSVPGYRPDAVIIGPTFADETGVLCSRLDAMDIPYVFIDSYIEKASPLVTYTTDQFACGRIVGKIMRSISSPDAEYAIFSTERVGNIGSYNSRQRREGLMSYFAGEDLQTG